MIFRHLLSYFGTDEPFPVFYHRLSIFTSLLTQLFSSRSTSEDQPQTSSLFADLIQ